jgi:cell division protease FtsH
MSAIECNWTMPNNDNKDARSPNREGPRLARGFLFWIVLFAGTILVVTLLQQYMSRNPKMIQLGQFYNALHDHRVEAVRLEKSQISGIMYDTHGEKVEFTCEIFEEQIDNIAEGIRAANEKARELKARETSLVVDRRGELLKTFLFAIVPWIVLLLVFWFLLGRLMRGGAGGGVLSFGKSRARLVTKERVNVTFNDVAGIDEAKDEVKEVVEFLKSPRKFRKLGGRIPRGVLLIGPPGTGKTLLAKAIAGEAEVPFFSISGSDFVEMFVGVGASRVRDLFRQAKENSPCIIFLDEIDAVGRRRGAGLGGGHDEREQTLNAILVEMDGFDREEAVIIVAATNRPDVLDPALLRPGRFDRQVVVDLPDIRGREAILKVHAQKYKLAPDAKLEDLARGTPNFSGADLEAVLNEAALLATRAGKAAIEMEDLEESRDKIHWGRKKRSRVMDEEDRRITAVHESGHALLAKLLPDMEPVHKVTIIPQGISLGATMSLPEKDRYHIFRKKLLSNICTLLAGRVAEELMLGDISSGAQNDLERATQLARSMVCVWGMSQKLGPVAYIEEEETLFLGREITRRRDHSEAVAVMIDEEVKEIIMAQYQRARQIIEQNRERLGRLCDALLKSETLRGADLDAILYPEGLPAVGASTGE